MARQQWQLQAQSTGLSSQQTTPSPGGAAASWTMIPRPDEPQSQGEPAEFTALPASNIPFENLAVINGASVIGLIVDPGAARGLIGSATLREIFDEILRPRGPMKHAMWHLSKNEFTGISSQPQRSIGICVFPIGIVGMKTLTYRATSSPASLQTVQVSFHCSRYFGLAVACRAGASRIKTDFWG